MENDIKFNSICQCCLTDDAPMKNMLTETYQDVKLIENFEKCSGIDLLKDQPIETCKNICQKCEANLKISIEFRELCHTSQKMLKERLGFIGSSTTIKDEPLSDEEPLILYTKKGSSRRSTLFTQVFVKHQPSEDESLFPKTEDDKPAAVKSQVQAQNEDDDDDYFNNDDLAGGQDSDTDDESAPPAKIAKLEDKKPVEVKAEPPLEDETSTMPVSIMCYRCDQFLPTQKEYLEHRSAHLKMLNRKIANAQIDRNCYICKVDVIGYAKHLKKEHRDFRPHTCQQCKMSFEKTVFLAKHLYRHLSAKRFKCLGCKTSHKSKSTLHHHIASKQHSKTSYHCIACGLGFKEFKNLHDHYTDKHASEFYKNLYPCFRCKRIFIKKELAQNHNNCKRPVALKVPPGKHNCPKCDKQFTNEDEMVCHKFTLCEPPAKVQKEIRARKIKMHKCPDCDEEFTSVDEMVSHKTTTCMKRFPCSGCDRHYKNKRDRNRHYVSTHTNRIQNPEERTRICDTCGAEFANQQSLHKHKKEQHDPNFVKKRVYFHCHEPGCGKVLQSKHAFATHQTLMHSERQFFRCYLCPRKFRTLGTIRAHVVEHATDPNELLTVACDFCEKKFVDEQSLKLHHRAHVYAVQNNSVQCDKCLKTFSNRVHLRSHIKRMHDEFYYECCYCKSSFGSKQSLNYHLYEHRGFRPYHCTVCPAQFTKQYIFVNHLSTHGITFDKNVHGYIEQEDLTKLWKSCERVGKIDPTAQPQRHRFRPSAIPQTFYQ